MVWSDRSQQCVLQKVTGASWQKQTADFTCRRSKIRSIRINCSRCAYNLNAQHLTRLYQTRYRNTQNTHDVIAPRLGVFEGIGIGIADEMQSKAKLLRFL